MVNENANATPPGAEPAVIEVAIGPSDTPGTFKVEVIRSPAGEASTVVELPADTLLARRSELQDALLSSPVADKRSPHLAEQPVREVGVALFTALLGTGVVAELYRASAMLAGDREQGLRVVLRIDSPELGGLPWEAMYDKTTGSYVCRREQFVRHVPVPVATAPLSVQAPLRILGVISAPRALGYLNVDRERGLLDAALAQPVADGLVEVTWTPAATWDGLHDLLMAGPWHVLHFIGHGDFDADADEGTIALARTNGLPDIIEASRFADLLCQARPMPRLVVLNCCSGADAGTTDLFAGTAAALARAGVPAVAAMQFAISDRAAAAFAGGFYTAIARGRGVDYAVSAGRIAIVGTSSRSLEWISPVLYLRGERVQLFTSTAPPVGKPAPDRRGSHASSPAAPATPAAVETGALAGHAFISCSDEDSAEADQLQRLLLDAGIPVWRDTEDLWPGEDRRTQIRRVISRDALAFLACFSRASVALAKSRQNEDLLLAIDEVRQRNPLAPWLIPIRFDDCQIPDRDIGGGRTLASIQHTDLFGDRQQQNEQRLIKAIQRMLGH